MFTQVAAIGCFGWYVAVFIVTTIGTVQIFRHYSHPPRKPISSHLESDHVPHVTVIRPCKGLEPFLYECLAATFHQDYPIDRTTIHFCVASKNDAAYPILQQLVNDYPAYDTQIFIEEEDPVVQELDGGKFGPNPKIRNMSRAYRNAKGDIIWILDCNIWLGYGALGRMVDKLCGFTAPSTIGQQAQTHKPYKLVAHLPVCIDVDSTIGGNFPSRWASASDDPSTVPLMSTNSTLSSPSRLTGNMLEMSFLSTAHAKMYVAINSVSIAPCINGKSTMFRKSHLNSLTDGQGIDYFSYNICEDHLIGDLLWKSHIPATLGFDEPSDMSAEINKSNPRGLNYRNHGLAVGDLAVQPLAKMTVTSYIARRVRWLRVRKFTVILATLVEPGTESLLCCIMGAFGATTITGLREWFGSSWASMALLFTGGILYWVSVDWFVSGIIQGMGSVETKKTISNQQVNISNVVVPSFATPFHRRLPKWLLSWVGREGLAFPIWSWAIWGGTTVTWRENKFWVGMDMRVHEIPMPSSESGVSRTELNNNSSSELPTFISIGTSSQNGRTGNKDGKIE